MKPERNRRKTIFDSRLAKALSCSVWGAVILISRFVFGRLLLPGYWQLYLTSPATNRTTPLLVHWPSIEYPNAWLAYYLALGVVALGCGIARTVFALISPGNDEKGRSNTRLDLTQSALGCLLVILWAWYLIGVERNLNLLPSLVIAVNGGVTHSPVWIRVLLCWKVAVVLLGLASVWFETSQLRGGDS